MCLLTRLCRGRSGHAYEQERHPEKPGGDRAFIPVRTPESAHALNEANQMLYRDAIATREPPADTDGNEEAVGPDGVGGAGDGDLTAASELAGGEEDIVVKDEDEEEREEEKGE
jgi:hypothetical protein